MSSAPPTSTTQEYHRGADRTEERLRAARRPAPRAIRPAFEQIDVGGEIVGPADDVQQTQRRRGDHRPTDSQPDRTRGSTSTDQRHADRHEHHRHRIATEPGEPAEQRLDATSQRTGEIEVHREPEQDPAPISPSPRNSCSRPATASRISVFARVRRDACSSGGVASRTDCRDGTRSWSIRACWIRSCRSRLARPGLSAADRPAADHRPLGRAGRSTSCASWTIPSWTCLLHRTNRRCSPAATHAGRMASTLAWIGGGGRVVPAQTGSTLRMAPSGPTTMSSKPPSSERAATT